MLKSLTLLALATLPLAACGGADEAGETTDVDAGISTASAAAYWSDTPIMGAREIRVARDGVKDGEAVVLRGTLQEFGELSTFRLVDDALKDCSETHDDGCTTPWDYCCADPVEVQQWTVNVEFLEEGLPGDWSLKGKHGLDRLSEVIVAGTFRKDEAGNLRLEADRMSLQ
ncbi:MAG: hypothetical protein ACJAZN_000820 [Planctomycetota bacterium]|jgi:hypothetical protein